MIKGFKKLQDMQFIQQKNDERNEIILVSKSKMKRRARLLKQLGLKLVLLSKSTLDKIQLDADLCDAITLARRVKHEGFRRQIQFIGKILRNKDQEYIWKVLDDLKKCNNQQAFSCNKINVFCDKLLSQGGDIILEILKNYPQADPQRLQILVRNAKKNQVAGRSYKTKRKIYQYLCTLNNVE